MSLSHRAVPTCIITATRGSLPVPFQSDTWHGAYPCMKPAASQLMMQHGVARLLLLQVCRLRGLPIYTFINKMDRPSKGPIALLDEIEGE